MKKNIKIYDKKSVSIDEQVVLGDNVVIHENVVIRGKSEIGDNVEIMGCTYIIDSKIGSGSKVVASFIEQSEVGEDNNVGPFARLRPGSKTGKNVRIGNFVEIKNSVLGDGCKVAHLAYIGDADVGKNVNIGCGVIFVNYDGKQKHRIRVCDGAFIGSNCNLIAPLTIAEKSYICAGTTVTQSTEKEDFVIGRVRPVVKPGRGGKYLK
mgnify:CR=1 FL=1